MLALNFMHGLGILHRDIKPENVLCEDFKETPRNEIHIKLADFGLAVKTQPGQKLWTEAGTPKYLAPEMIRSRSYDAKVDVWSTGVLVFKMLTGKNPFEPEVKPKNRREYETKLKQCIRDNEPNFAIL